jgi:hypothetical protein
MKISMSGQDKVDFLKQVEKTNYLPQVTDKINNITLKTTSHHERDSNSQLYVFINHIHIYFFAEIFPTTISSLSQFRMLTDY